jgi:hypothetical protein
MTQTQILSNALKPASLDPAEAPVAAIAQQSSHLPGVMVMVDGEPISAGRAAAQRALAMLRLDHRVVFCAGEAVAPLEPRVRAASVMDSALLRRPVGATSPRAISDAFLTPWARPGARVLATFAAQAICTLPGATVARAQLALILSGARTLLLRRKRDRRPASAAWWAKESVAVPTPAVVMEAAPAACEHRVRAAWDAACRWHCPTIALSGVRLTEGR